MPVKCNVLQCKYDRRPASSISLLCLCTALLVCWYVGLHTLRHLSFRPRFIKECLLCSAAGRPSLVALTAKPSKSMLQLYWPTWSPKCSAFNFNFCCYNHACWLTLICSYQCEFHHWPSERVFVFVFVFVFLYYAILDGRLFFAHISVNFTSDPVSV